MGRYTFEWNREKRISASTMITMTDTEAEKVYKFTKAALTRGYPLPYNQELCNGLFEIDNYFYQWFPVEFRTDAMTRTMIEKYYTRFYPFYPVEYRTPQMSMDYVRHANSHLWYVPREQVTQEMCDIYAVANVTGLREVPDEFIKPEYIDRIYEKGFHLGTVPVEQRTKDVCMRFIRRWSHNIQFVPDEVLSEICSEMGINYREDLTLPADDFWMKKKTQKKD